MREIPDYFYEWIELDLPGTGKRLMKPDTPEDIRQRLIAEEKRFFKSTARRCIINIDIEENDNEEWDEETLQDWQEKMSQPMCPRNLTDERAQELVKEGKITQESYESMKKRGLIEAR